jgi:glycerophosphoryl diester phosphodiesterase
MVGVYLQGPDWQRFMKEYLNDCFYYSRTFILILITGWSIPILLTACSEINSEPDIKIVAHRGAMSERPENTMSAFHRAVDLGADIVEIDLRTSKDGHLFILHDEALDRTTNGAGSSADFTMEELQELDAGSWFNPAYAEERIPAFEEVLGWAKDYEVELLLDLKEYGYDFTENVVNYIQNFGNADKVIIGVRSPEQAHQFRELLPDTRQLAFMGLPDEIITYAGAGVDVIRLWLHWLEEDPSLADQVREKGIKLMINGTAGELDEAEIILNFSPDWILIDDVDQLQRSIATIQNQL